MIIFNNLKSFLETQLVKNASSNKILALDFITTFYQAISNAPILWDKDKQEMVHCGKTRVWELLNIWGMTIVGLLYLIVLNNQLHYNEEHSEVHVSLMSLMIFFAAILNCILAVSTGQSLLSHCQDYAAGFNMLKGFEERLKKEYEQLLEKPSIWKKCIMDMAMLNLASFYTFLPLVSYPMFLIPGLDPALYICEIYFGRLPSFWPFSWEKLPIHLPRFSVRVFFLTIFGTGAGRLGFCLLTIIIHIQRVVSVVGIIETVCKKDLGLGMALHTQLQVINNAIRGFQEAAAMGLLATSFFIGGFTNYITFQGYRVVPPLIYLTCSTLSVLKYAAMDLTVPACVMVNVVSSRLVEGWKTGDFGTIHRTKLLRKRAKGINPLKLDFSVNGHRVFSMRKHTKNRYLQAEMELTINLLMAYPRDKFENAFTKNSKKKGLISDL